MRISLKSIRANVRTAIRKCKRGRAQVGCTVDKTVQHMVGQDIENNSTGHNVANAKGTFNRVRECALIALSRYHDYIIF